MSQESRVSGFVFIGNYGCLDFINTVYNYNGDQVDLLQDFYDLVDWLYEANIIDRVQREKAVEKWGNTPQADFVVKKAQEFRKVLFTLGEQINETASVPYHIVEEINFYLYLRKEYPSLHRTQDGNYIISRHREMNDPLQLVALIAESAADLLASGHVSAVKKCENHKCILHFYDKSKNRSRRWWNMKTCGNRTKAAAHYHREWFLLLS